MGQRKIRRLPIPAGVYAGEGNQPGLDAFRPKSHWMESRMKTIAALIAGLLLSTMTFVAGLAIALTLLNIDEPARKLDSRNAAALWPTKPVAVDKAAQSFERVAARPYTAAKQATRRIEAPWSGQQVKAALTGAETENTTIDPETTASIRSQPTDRDPGVRRAQTAAHIEWCSRRYRSYNAEDNSYRPYGGGRRPCQSPYSEPAAALSAENRAGASDGALSVQDDAAAIDDRSPSVEQASYAAAATGYAEEEHIQSCFERYRSYRPEDNSYQPYDGGPRQQCRSGMQ